ncbi:DUF1642 domain-containing protein [Lactiplantibacillus plantarum]|uniref:DUF1642 domain-containing protein n=1 Tax=Lactiplantibacillus plantarum TaxID=1590 RepID=UPI003896C4EF
MTSNDTKRDVFERALDEWYSLVFAVGDQGEEAYGYCEFDGTISKYEKDYDDALPDNLPVIPNYVAEYIDVEKNNTDVIQAGIDAIEYSKGSIELTAWIEENGDAFARAWLDGYRVEEEK